MKHDTTEFEKAIEALEIRLKQDRETTYKYKMEKRNRFQKFFNIKPDMSFCDQCIAQDRNYSIMKLREKLYHF